MRVVISQVQLVILFCILFIAIGWVAPAAYATYAPQENFITVNEFSAQDTTTTAEEHLICFDRNVKNPNTGRVFIELYLTDGGNKTVEVNSETVQRYFQGGEKIIETSLDLPPQLEEGQYRYVQVIKMELANGRVEREFVFESEPFNITSGAAPNTTTATFECG